LAVGLTDELLALDRETGQKVWSFSTGTTNENFALNASPALLGERVYFGGLNGFLHCLDVRTGREFWKRDLGSRISAGVIASANAVYAGTSDGRIYLLKPEKGEVIAQIDTKGVPNGRFALSRECLLTFLGEREIACYSRSLDRQRWTRLAPKAWSSSRPYAWNRIALAGDDTGELSAFRLADGEVVWSESLGETIRGIGTSSAGLYVGTLNGLVFARPWPNATMPAKRTTSAAQLRGSTFRQ
jgi:eukaryotic-like serine/threonine-protein kinase